MTRVIKCIGYDDHKCRKVVQATNNKQKRCHSCAKRRQSEIIKIWRRDHLEISRAGAKTRQIRNRRNYPKRYVMIRLRQNARVGGRLFNLKEEDIPDFPEFCPIFPWIKLVYAVGKGRCDGSVSIDRIDNDKGYVPGNIRAISYRANCAKSDSTDQELVLLGRDARKRINKLQNKARTYTPGEVE